MRLRVHLLRDQRVRPAGRRVLSVGLALAQRLNRAPDARNCCRASDKCQREKRKTINGDDLLWALSTLGFDEYVGPLKLYLQRYREVRVGAVTARASWPLPGLRVPQSLSN